MLLYYWACVADNDAALNQQRVKSICLLGTLNVLPFEKQIYLSFQKYKKSVLSVQKLAQMRKCVSTCSSA